MRDTDHRPDQTFDAARVIAELGTLPTLKELSSTPLNAVMILRYCALCDQARRDPLADLATHFGSVAIAQAAIELVDCVKRSWPEPYIANRPCCQALTEHEATLGVMIRNAGSGERAQFQAQIRGFVRQDRHERLYSVCAMLAAQLQSQPAANRRAL